MKDTRARTDTYEKARAILRSKTIIPDEDNPSVYALISGILFVAEECKQANVRELLCALATYAKALERQVVVADVHHKLGETLGELVADREMIQELADEQQAARTRLEGALGKLTEEVSKLSASNAKLSKEVEERGKERDEAEEMIRQARRMTEQMGENRSQPLGPGNVENTVRSHDGRQPTYATVVQHVVPQQHAADMVKQGMRDRQVLVDFLSEKDKEASGKMSEAELVTKANEAVGMVRQETGDTNTPTITFLSVRKLRHGGCLYEVNSGEASQWLKRDANMRAFQLKFGLQAIVKARHYPVVLKNLPIGFDPSEAVYRQIEKENGWETRDLAVMHWIKPPKRRRDGQQTAFAIAKFSTAKAANRAILYGLTFRGQKIQTWRQLKEARRCLRCQRLEPGHLAANCQEKEACGTCASPDHTTGECANPDGVFDRYCVNCNDPTHASWDRTCPVFAELNRRLQLANPLEKYRCYPIPEDPTSWEERYISDTPICELPQHLARRFMGARLTQEETGAHAASKVHPDRMRNIAGHEAGWTTAGRKAQPEQRREMPPHQTTPREAESTIGNGTQPDQPDAPPKPQAVKVGGKQRQATLTRDGGFTTRRPHSRTASRASRNSAVDDDTADADLWRALGDA